jgi:SAP domain
MTIRLYHPDLEPPHNECEVMNEDQAAIYAESGWKPAPEPEAPRPGYAAEPVRYAPVVAELEVDDGEYDGMTKDELQAELRDRGLSTSGNKDELVSRLYEDDQAEPEPEPSD